jgi:NAD(P)-dependent dehydrogenase (short-subunit alcohol dehydrogenase family)
MDIRGRNVLVLGGYGLVGSAVCRAVLAHEPARLVIASLRREEAEAAVERLRKEFPKSAAHILPAWGDIFLRAEWQANPSGVHPREAVLAHPALRRQLIADTLDELSEDMISASLLTHLILGLFPGLGKAPAHIIVDCMNTATGVAYQNIYRQAQHVRGALAEGGEGDLPEHVENLLAVLYIPQLVRHTQIYYEAMRRAGTQALIKVGTSGTGGMGFNIPYTHGEERPSRVLLSKSAVAGAQTLLLYLLARTPNAPVIVKEIMPTAAIAWKEIAFGPIHRAGRPMALYDCPPAAAVPAEAAASRAPQGDFGTPTGGVLESVYIDTGENGLFSTAEFETLTTLGQMEFITPEEIAADVVREILGGNTGHDVIGALDGASSGPTYRAGFLREAALNRLHQLERQHKVESVAFELLGPPRLSKLLFEAHLLKRTTRSMSDFLGRDPAGVAMALEREIAENAPLRQQIVSIGLGILMPEGERLLRGPMLKADRAEDGWIDLTPANIVRWQKRLAELRRELRSQPADETSSRVDRALAGARRWSDEDGFEIGEMAGWVFNNEERGRRAKR